MKILSIETSGRRATCALAQGPNLLASAETPSEQRTASSLFPLVRQLLHDQGWQPADVELIGLTLGPGSFTGLRIGVTMAKTLAYVNGAEVLGLNTLRVIAAQTSALPSAIDAVLDAQRQELFAARYRVEESGQLAEVVPTSIVPIDSWLANLEEGTQVAGPVLQKLRDRLPPHVQVCEQQVWSPQATMVAQLAWQDYQSGRRNDLWTLSPQYFRKSAAEEKLRQG